MTATFSVVIPLYDKAPFVERTIETVLGQTLAPTEIIVVDDQSTDGGAELVEQRFGARVRVIRQANAGPGPARNRGVAEASAQWIAFLDADDLWRPDHLATLARLAADFPEASLLSTSYEFGRPGQTIETPPPAAETVAIVDYFELPLDRQTMWTSCIAVDRAAFLASGGFGAFFPGEDPHLWVRLALTKIIALSSAVTAIYVRETLGLMERHEPRGHKLQPVFGVLADALADDSLRPRHAAVRNYRAKLLRRNIRQALARCEPRAARAYRRDLATMADRGAGWVGLLAFLPRSVLRAGLALRRRLRGK